MKEYEKAKRKEIENILKIINLKFSKIEKEHEQITMICDQMKEKLIQAENIIDGSGELFKKSNTDKRYKHITNSCIHNPRRFRWGIAMMKLTEEKHIRTPLTPKYKFNRYRRTWRKEYWIYNSNGIYKYREFYEENKEFII